jgi:tRNA A-37 threonylcarbamoyl transferase component Bud32
MAQIKWEGQSLGDRYKVEEVIGQGGMSAVYKATDPNLKRVVAIKLIHPHLSENEEFVIRFKEEAAAVAQLRHPNIVQVFDFDSDGDVYYMVLEFVAGETLQARLKRLNAAGRRMPTVEALKFAAQICDAVDYAHQRGMIHRDIKPANVMLDVYGKAILMDFGIAKIIGGQYHTATGATLGTAVYMSPEQIRGDRIDERSDIYSIGVTLFEMVSGRPPYEADSAMTLMMMHLNDPIPDLRQVQPDTPAELVALIEKALSKDRAERFQSAAEMAAALRRLSERLESPVDSATVVEYRVPDDEQPDRVAVGAAAAGVQSQIGTGPEAVAPASPRGRPAVQPPDVGGPEATPRVAVGPVAGWVAKLKGSPLLLAGVGGVILLLIAVVLVSTLSGNGGNDAAAQALGAQNTPAAQGQVDEGQGAGGTDSDATPTRDATATAAALAAGAVQTVEPSATPVPSATAAPPTATPPPTATRAATSTPTTQPTANAEPTQAIYTATPTSTPTAPPAYTQPPDPYVSIRGITVQDNVYVVDYETLRFTESQDGWHIHFFFNTVTPEQAGLPGVGPWIVYYGPNPFTLYSVGDRPADATQMCARVANADHTLYNSGYSGINTGNCANLP